MSTLIATSKPIPVDGPVPTAPPHNIWTVAQEPVPLSGQDSPGRWNAGMNVWPFTPFVATGFDNCSQGTFDVKEEGEPFENAEFLPFETYVAIICSTLGLDWEGLKRRAEEALDATDHDAVERQLVAGTYVGNADTRYLGDVAVGDILGGGAVQAAQGVSFLENAIGATAREGIIHVDPATASSMWGNYEVPTPGGDGVLRTVRGTRVIVGTGYIGAKPDNGAVAGAGESWAFASGPVLARRSETIRLTEELKESLDRALNEVVYRAERDTVVGWDGQFSAAVLINWNP